MFQRDESSRLAAGLIPKSKECSEPTATMTKATTVSMSVGSVVETECLVLVCDLASSLESGRESTIEWHGREAGHQSSCTTAQTRARPPATKLAATMLSETKLLTDAINHQGE